MYQKRRVIVGQKNNLSNGRKVKPSSTWRKGQEDENDNDNDNENPHKDKLMHPDVATGKQQHQHGVTMPMYATLLGSSLMEKVWYAFHAAGYPKVPVHVSQAHDIYENIMQEMDESDMDNMTRDYTKEGSCVLTYPDFVRGFVHHVVRRSTSEKENTVVWPYVK